MRHDIRFLDLIGLVALGLFAACGPATTLEAGWTSRAAYTEPPMAKVVAAFPADNMTIRRSGEERLARELAAKGVVATPAYAVLSDDETQTLATTVGRGEQITPPVAAKLKALGYDGIVTMRIVDREQDLNYSPPAYPGWGYWGYGYGGYWDYGGGYAYTTTIYRLETNAYSLRTNQVVWTGLVKSTDPDTAHQLVGEATHVVASQLAKNRLAG